MPAPGKSVPGISGCVRKGGMAVPDSCGCQDGGETDEMFDDGSHIVYVNGNYKGWAVGRLHRKIIKGVNLVPNTCHSEKRDI